jgi:ATP-dependent DNA helicase DinG
MLDEWRLGDIGQADTPEEVREYLREAGFPESRISRGFRRRETVQDYKSDSWLVRGVSSMGDYFQGYQVSLEGRKYDCACYYHKGGDTRRQQVCTHILGTIIARRMGLITGRIEDIEVPDNILTIPEPGQPISHTQRQGPVPITDDLRPCDLGFDPEQFPSYRPQQITALRRIVESDKKYILLQAPTGVGKTLIAASLQRLLRQQVVYCCTTKQLQDQAVHDFGKLANGVPFGKTLKGKANYPTLLHSAAFPSISAEVCVGTAARPHCQWCCDGTDQEQWGKEAPCSERGKCPYILARNQARTADFPILNLSMFINITKGEGNPNFAEAGALVIDEADVIENVLMGDCELRFTQRWVERLELSPPAKVTVKEAWIDWVKETALPRALWKRKEIIDEIEGSDEWGTVRPNAIRDRNWLTHAAESMQTFLASVARGDPWVWMPTDWAFKPVKVGQFGEELLWSKAERVILMSASLLSAEAVASDLGIGIEDIEFIDLPTDFAKARRPLYYQPAVSMAYKNRQEATPKMLWGIDGVLDRHEGQKVLVHTVSYDLARYIWEKSRHQSRLLSYGKARDRVDVLDQFIQADYPAVLLAPSMERGVDLPGDLCRVVVVCKVPFPNLGDRQVAERFYGTGSHGRRWYAIQTARALLQMTGRGMRYEGDWCLTYILDEQFYRFYQEWGWKLLPEYWKEAIVWPDK